MPDTGEVRPSTRAVWRRWLQVHHDSSRGVWLVWHKQRSRPGELTLEDAIQEALCFGWIDSRLRPIDAEWSALMFTPRRPRSVWSARTKARIAFLTDKGLMTEAGLRTVAEAKKNGSWTSLDAVENLVVPGDLAEALAADPAGRRRFEALTRSAKKMALWSIVSAKRPATRARRIAEVVSGRPRSEG